MYQHHTMKRCKYEVTKYQFDVEIRNSDLEGQEVVIFARGTQIYKALTKRGGTLSFTHQQQVTKLTTM